MFKRTILIVSLLAAIFYFSGCNTLHGLGGDVKWTGEQIEAGASNFTSDPGPAPKK
jgi:predicted small secreted protein